MNRAKAEKALEKFTSTRDAIENKSAHPGTDRVMERNGVVFATNGYILGVINPTEEYFGFNNVYIENRIDDDNSKKSKFKKTDFWHLLEVNYSIYRNVKPVDAEVDAIIAACKEAIENNKASKKKSKDFNLKPMVYLHLDDENVINVLGAGEFLELSKKRGSRYYIAANAEYLYDVLQFLLCSKKPIEVAFPELAYNHITFHTPSLYAVLCPIKV